MPKNGYINKVKPDYPKWQSSWYEHNKEVIQSVSDKSYSYQAGYLAAVNDVIKYLEEEMHPEHKWSHNHFLYASMKIAGEFLDEV